MNKSMVMVYVIFAGFWKCFWLESQLICLMTDLSKIKPFTNYFEYQIKKMVWIFANKK